MPNFGDLLGAFVQNATAPSGDARMGNALEGLQQTGLGGAVGGQGAGGGAMGGLLGGILDTVKGQLSSAVQNPAKAGGIGAVLGSLLGGGSGSVKGAVGGGALAMLAGVAMKSLMNGGQQTAGAQALAGGTLPVGLKAPETPDEQQELEDTAALVLKAMINAAKSDGEIGPQEVQRIVGKLEEVGADQESRDWVLNEMRQPLDLDGFVAEIPDQDAAAKVYAASLLSIEVDTDAERAYLQQLAQRTGLNQTVVQYINQSMGVAA